MQKMHFSYIQLELQTQTYVLIQWKFDNVNITAFYKLGELGPFCQRECFCKNNHLVTVTTACTRIWICWQGKNAWQVCIFYAAVTCACGYF